MVLACLVTSARQAPEGLASNRSHEHHGVATVHKVTNPHDKFFKEVFSQKKMAVDFLANYLPSDILQVLNLETMAIRKDSFIDEEFRESFSDLLYEVKLADSPAYIYVLFEHKSFSDRFTAFQLLKYMIRIWELHLRQSTKRDLPVILPLVLYQGSGTWEFGHQFRDLLDSHQEALFPYVPNFQFIVYDLSQYLDEQIKGGVVARVMLLAMKYALRDELPEKLPGILNLLGDLAEKDKGLHYLEVLFRYLVQGTDKLSSQDFERALSNIPEGGAIMSTLAEQWFHEGKEKGLLEGMMEGQKKGLVEGEKRGLVEGQKKGMMEGRLQEACEVTLELIEMHFGVPSQSLIGKLHQLRSHEVLRFLRRQMKNCKTAADFEDLVEKALR
jgi:predicted transposase/invertase (TIGR01784 family)